MKKILLFIAMIPEICFGQLKISQLTDNPSISGTEMIPLAKSGSNYKETFDNLKTWINTGVGSVTSVGLTMPSGFSVASSPVTGSGTIAVTGAGTTSQYIRGDGSLATTPVLTNEWHISGNSVAATGADFIGTTNSASIWFRTNNTQRMRLDSVGRLGIGTISPNALIQVSGLIEFNPSTYKTALGEDALKNNSGNYNVGISYHAGGGSGAGISGERNICIGFDAGGRITSGTYNTFIGVGAGQLTTTSSRNIAIGSSSMAVNTTGADNTVVGTDAMNDNTTGYQNDVFGTDAMAFNTTGGYNAVFGGGGAHPNLTGDTNTFVGVDGGRYNTVGGFNVSLGTNATPALIVPFDNLSGGPFTIGEQISNLTSGGYGYLIKIVGSNLFLAGGSGVVRLWGDNDNLSGVSSSATAQINGTPDNPDYTISIGASMAGGTGTIVACTETGEINIGNVLRGKQSIALDSTLNLVRLTGNTTITEGLAFSRTSINTTAGDAATINAPAGRFRKDTSGTAFTLTNSFITANSIIQLTAANAAIDASAFYMTVSAGSSTATITFNAAPTSNFDVNFVVIN